MNYRKKSILQIPLRRAAIRYPHGHFLDKVYAFSRHMNPLDYDPTYPKNPETLGQYIRKYRKDKGLLCRELAERLGVAKFTVIKWEGGRMPRYEKQIRLLREGIPGVGRFLVSENKLLKNKSTRSLERGLKPAGPHRDIPRTWDRLIQKLVEFFKNNLGPDER